jgi:predicted Holliday junction resolvase-like endonuclease
MEQDRPRWRIRIGTLMLLVIILALVLALIVERGRKAQEMRRLELAQTEALRAEAEARRLMQRAMEARARALERVGLAEAVLRSSSISDARKSRDEMPGPGKGDPVSRLARGSRPCDCPG